MMCQLIRAIFNRNGADTAFFFPFRKHILTDILDPATFPFIDLVRLRTLCSQGESWFQMNIALF